MRNEQSIDIPEDWKMILRNNLLAGIIGNPIEKNRAFNEIGRMYQCYAPAYIYKYYPPSFERLETLKKNKLWYSTLDRFNDVFDGDFPTDEKAIYKSVLKQIGICEGSPVGMGLIEQMPQLMRDFSYTMEQVRCTTGVACFSERYDSLLMWAHYAYNHQGICVEYELLKFNTELNYSPVPIIYTNERVHMSEINMNRLQEDSVAFLVNGLTTKSMEWQYENEWRIIRDRMACGDAWDDEKKGALLPSVKPRSIILGCNASDEFEREVCSFCKESEISLYKMEKDEDKFKLNKKTIIKFDT